MLPLKILLVFGTRPEAIKMAPLVRVLRQEPEVEVRVAVTAQHREMLDQVLDLFDIVPAYDLNIMRHGQTLADITGRVISGIQQIIHREGPAVVLVHGDTTTSFASALASFYEKVPVGHVEAGLRTGDKFAPFPEEMNRRLTGALADFHFAPTFTAKKNLIKEGTPAAGIFVTGNTVIDALFQTVRRDYTFEDPLLQRLDFNSKRVILVTAHRRENWGEPMKEIFSALGDLAAAFPDVEVVFPVHKNPALQRLAGDMLGELDSVHLIQPLEYEPLVNLMARSFLVMTDSGGLQEEAPALGKPVLVMRRTTERPEAVLAGTVRLVGTDRKVVVQAAAQLLTNGEEYSRMARAVNPYGDGKASQRIRDWLLNHFGLKSANPVEFQSFY